MAASARGGCSCASVAEIGAPVKSTVNHLRRPISQVHHYGLTETFSQSHEDTNFYRDSPFSHISIFPFFTVRPNLSNRLCDTEEVSRRTESKKWPSESCDTMTCQLLLLLLPIDNLI